MDRYIKLYLKQENSRSIKHQILYGLKDGLLHARGEWFGKNAININWEIEDSSDIESEILDSIRLVFAILDKESSEREYASVSAIFDDIARLAVAQTHNITSYSRYKTCICSADVAFRYILYKLGYVETVVDNSQDDGGRTVRKSLQLKGESPKRGNNGKLIDISFKDVADFISRRIEALESYGIQRAGNIPKLLERLKDIRNKESHNAFYTDPEKFWTRIVYMIYDYVTVIFFLMRYFKGVQDKSIKPVDYEDLDAVSSAIDKAEDLIRKTGEIHVRFQFTLDREKKQKLLIQSADDSNERFTRRPLAFPTTKSLDDGSTICYYDKIIDKSARYTLQSFYVRNGVDIPEGERLELNTSLLFDGAVVALTLPTKEIPYPQIESIIAESTGLIEDRENREVVEKLLADNIQDEQFRNKLRILLLLDKGDKELIAKEFVEKGTSGSDDFISKFKEYIEAKSNEQEKQLKESYNGLLETIKNSQNNLAENITNAVSNIDICSIINKTDEIKSELIGIRKDFNKWCDLHKELEKRNAEKADKMYGELKCSVDDANQTLQQFHKTLNSQNNTIEKLLKKIKYLLLRCEVTK